MFGWNQVYFVFFVSFQHFTSENVLTIYSMEQTYIFREYLSENFGVEDRLEVSRLTFIDFPLLIFLFTFKK